MIFKRTTLVKLIKIIRNYPILVFSMLVVLGWCLYGIGYGDWNPDTMAFRKVKHSLFPFLPPSGYNKPPFYIYLNLFTIRLPVKIFASLFDIPAYQEYFYKLILSKILVAGMLVTCIAYLHSLTKQVFNLFVANCLALLFVTSTYLIHSHYLTTDIPLMFFLILSFYYSSQIILSGTDTVKPYLLAGIFIGVASATKYNGIALGIAIPLAHTLRMFNLKGFISFKEMMNQKLWMGLLAILIAFIFATPNAVLEYKKFWSDFYWNYTIAPIWGGQLGDVTNYKNYLLHALRDIPDVLLFVFIILGNILFLLLCLKKNKTKIDKKQISFYILLFKNRRDT